MTVNEEVLDYLFMFVMTGGMLSGSEKTIRQIMPCSVARLAEGMGLIQIVHEQEPESGPRTNVTIELTAVGRKLVGLDS